MAQEVRAVYENGRLRVLDPVSLGEGEQVQVMILREQEHTRAALSDLLVAPGLDTGDVLDEAGLQAEIDAAMQRVAPVSTAIIQERQEGP